MRSLFLNKYLLGDIVINEEQELILKEYMKRELKRFDKNPDNFEPLSENLFAFGLVRYAMDNYNKTRPGAFWPYFKEEYGIDIKSNEQTIINDIFKNIMKKYNKLYINNISNNIDNITMHSFVSTNCANKLFDYIFTFWRLDLNRNAKNLSIEENYDVFNTFIEAISKENVSAVMKHTACLLNPNVESKTSKTIFKNRIKRIIKLIDDSFWNETQINETGNRINKLLNLWMKDPKQEFLKEKNYIRKHDLKTKGEIIFHSPILKYNNLKDKLYISLPLHRLNSLNEFDNPYWQINSNDVRFEVIKLSINEKLEQLSKENYKKDKIGFYLNHIEVEIPFDLVLSNFEIFIYKNVDLIHKFDIKCTNIRLFNEKGQAFDYQSSNIPSGYLTAFSNNNEYPLVIGSKYEPNFKQDVFVYQLCLNDGQIIIFDNNIGYQVGKKITEGLNEQKPIHGVDCRFI